MEKYTRSPLSEPQMVDHIKLITQSLLPSSFPPPTTHFKFSSPYSALVKTIPPHSRPDTVPFQTHQCYHRRLKNSL
jgi:hypothetical protein